MPNVLIMDDEPLSLQRLSGVLSNGGRYDVSTAENVAEGVKVVENLGHKLDLLIIDVSMFGAAAFQMLDLFASACPQLRILVITPRLKDISGEHPQLRKPFTDDTFREAVNQVLAMQHGVVVEASIRRKSTTRCRPARNFVRVQTTGV